MRRLLQLAASVASLLAAACSPPAEPPAPALPQVSVLEVRPEAVSLTSEWVTTLDGWVNAQVRPQVTGYLLRRLYREGSRVQRGEVLFEIDPRPFEAVLAQARASLAQAEAELGRARQDVERDRPLAAERAIPQSQLDNDVQARLAAEAAVEAARAAVDTAELNRSFTRVRSLVDGIAAIATAQIGDLVGPQTLLTTVSQVDPIRAYFSLSEREYLAIAGRLNGRSGAEEDGPWTEEGGLRLWLADGSAYPPAGSFVAADRQIDPTTGTIRISASFPNPDHLLRPGQYGRVEATTGHVEEALLVPLRALSELQGRSQLRLLNDDDTVRVVTVELGPRVGQRRIVRTGLESGDRVVIDAPQLRDGTSVAARAWSPPRHGGAGAGAPAEESGPRSAGGA